MPVPVSPVDRQRRSVLIEFGLQQSHQFAILRVNRTDTGELVVVFRDLQHPLTRHALSQQDILQKGNHVLPALRSAERHDQDGIIGSPHAAALVLSWRMGMLNTFMSPASTIRGHDTGTSDPTQPTASRTFAPPRPPRWCIRTGRPHHNTITILAASPHDLTPTGSSSIGSTKVSIGNSPYHCHIVITARCSSCRTGFLDNPNASAGHWKASTWA